MLTESINNLLEREVIEDVVVQLLMWSRRRAKFDFAVDSTNY
jgi:hypothetical protein